jgi:hypothetical protein
MKIDKEHFDNATVFNRPNEKYYTFVQYSKNIGIYRHATGEIWFDTETLERLGHINMADNWTTRKNYWYANFMAGWDGKNKTNKEFVKRLCTRADYNTAKALLLEEIKKYNEAK